MASTGKRICLITGASGTLGRAFCRRYADRYHIVAVYNHNAPSGPSESQSVVDPLNPLGLAQENTHPLFTIKADLSTGAGIERVVDLVMARFARVDLLVNGAGMAVWAPLVSSDKLLASLDAQFHLNAVVPAVLATTVARRFWRDRGRENELANRNVVNVSSTAGVYIYPGQGQSGYSASKAALNYLTCHMAEEFSTFGVRVNAAAPNSFPGLISTDRVADMIVTLDEGTMNGRILVLDQGGETMI